MSSQENGYKDVDKWSTGFCHSRETIDLAFCPILEHGGKQRQAY